MKMSDELTKIKDILEEIRSSEYPEIPQEIIEEVLSAQIENMDDGAKSQKAIRAVVDNKIKSMS